MVDKRIEIVSKSLAGDKALQQHLDDQRKQPMRIRAAKNALFDEEVSKDPFVITIRPKHQVRNLPLSMFVKDISEALELNGGVAEKDFEVVVYE